MLLPFVPPAVLLCSTLFAEIVYWSILPRLAVYIAISASATASIFNPPFGNALLNYMNGFFSSWYIVWAANILFLYRIREIKRLRKSPNKDGYHWESLPPLGYTRLLWTLDLTTNFRGIGWEHATPKGGYAVLNESASDAADHLHSRSKCILKQVARLMIAYTAIDLSHHILVDWRFISDPFFTVAEIIGTALFIFGFIDGLHASIALLGVGLLSDEPWRYPTLFGKVTDLKRMRLKDLWGKLWHDLFKNGFLTVAQSVVSPGPPVLLFCFLLSSFVHAAASYSGSLDVRSTAWMVMFFIAQPVGVVAQGLLTVWVKDALGGSKSSPLNQAVLHMVDVVVGVVLIYNVFPWMSRDVAVRGSVLSYEVPWSVVDYVQALCG
ncbi:hypothetical protein ASPWEDRAFT_296908 [Aspergillus wentii DTO 134E9]|uniref:Wax synthase domain-containing protein n=1 Tax=Aspergillus wentii DTO 134E9 TaxID=1073089 RepID=A0A1L9R4G4_ASPWE|nr:uncharacterized protein ASPWEDRAFT_296908 [Aspergillus wentii DTO 134E9]KAI9927055.1 hypothetical protein MW887_003436 [Aspergillus wentii]OJJ29772.1 hypothetical protein ASPWEDRAFT_296908 [Aspergillus wentii DTO 134E9]